MCSEGVRTEGSGIVCVWGVGFEKVGSRLHVGGGGLTGSSRLSESFLRRKQNEGLRRATWYINTW